jgi:hypothetical protein
MSGRKRTIQWRPSYRNLKEAYVLRPGEYCCRGVEGPRGPGYTKRKVNRIGRFEAELMDGSGEFVPVERNTRIVKAYKCRKIKNLCIRNS